MEKYINIVLPDKTIDSLEFRHGFTVSRVGYYEEPRYHYIEREDLEDAVLLLCVGGSRYVEKALRFMQENLYADLDLQAVSRYLGISGSHTIRIFKSAFMITPMQYYNTLRLEEAGRQLLHTDETVAEISRRFGYSSQFYFSQQFKKKTGLSPTAYRKMMRTKF